MTARPVNPLYVFGLWLLYFFGGIIFAMALFGGADFVGPEKDSPTGWPAKIVSGVSPLAFAVAGLGMYIHADPTANQDGVDALRFGGLAVGGVLTIVALALIARDLARGPRRS